MPTRSTTSVALALILAGALPACSTPKPEPEIASSASLGHYAKSWPAELNTSVKGFSDRRAEIRKILGELPAQLGKLKDPDWGHVLDIVTRADEDGRGYAYVERARRVEAVQAFFDTEKDELARKVSGSVVFVAKKKSCDPEVANGVPPAQKEAFEKQMEKELDDATEAQQLVDRYKGELGKENTAVLEKLAKDVSRASYLVHVQIVEDKLRITRMVTEADRIRRTADETIEAERAFQNGKKVTDAEKKASHARIEEMNKSKASIDAAMKQAEAIAPSMADEIQKITKEYDDAIEALKTKIRDKKH
ncbi:Hypothetical protein A7982_00446 [Minicystis rosea]|nr:Hypothetical protein A7982_00446 [Minicystis rosea]